MGQLEITKLKVATATEPRLYQKTVIVFNCFQELTAMSAHPLKLILFPPELSTNDQYRVWTCLASNLWTSYYELNIKKYPEAENLNFVNFRIRHHDQASSTNFVKF